MGMSRRSVRNHSIHMEPLYRSRIAKGALLALVGFILSGPVAVLIIRWMAPQPPWESISVFIEHYHPVQHLPYAFGFLLLAGLLMMVIGHFLYYQQGPPHIRLAVLSALCVTIFFCTLIFFNYITQLIFIHQLAIQSDPETYPLIASFTMANPMSLSWTLEMWGYALLGIATWLLRHCYDDQPITKSLLLINLVFSIASAVWVLFDVNWIFSSTGLVLYGLWNVLMIVILIRIHQYHRRAVYQVPPVTT